MKNSPWITVIVEGKIEDKPRRQRPWTPFKKQVVEDIDKKNTHIQLKINRNNRENGGKYNYINNLWIVK
jgi:hypothetical protein